MPQDPLLVERIRALVVAEPELTEKRMFGGTAFLVSGKLAVAASHTGGLMSRVDPDEIEVLMLQPHAAPMVMNGRTMKGWIRVDEAGVADDEDLLPWVRRGIDYARSLA